MLWLQLTAGRGPDECQLAVEGLVKVLLAEAYAAVISAKLLHVGLLQVERGTHGMLSALCALESDPCSLEGGNEETFAKSWEGTIQWTCPSPLRPGHKRKNWFVACNAIRPPAPTASSWGPADLRIDTFHASGPGGQNVNKTMTAVRLTHLPTGTVVQAQENRSQHHNKSLALARLAEALAAREAAALDRVEHDKWRKHDAVERGKPVRTYKGPKFERVQ